MKRSASARIITAFAVFFLVCLSNYAYADEGETAPKTAVTEVSPGTVTAAAEPVSTPAVPTAPAAGPDAPASNVIPAPATSTYDTPPASPYGQPAPIAASAPADAEHTSMVKMRGTYGMSMGFETDEFLWKKANGDWQEKNWRYAFGDTNVNTYDPRIFDRYELEIETDTKTPWNGYCDIVMDPWSFLQVGEQTITNAWGDAVDIRYQLWQNTGYTVNQTYRTRDGNTVTLPEIKVVGNHVRQTSVTPALFGSPNFIVSPGNDAKLDYIFRPVRKLWVDYKEDPLYFKVFPIADQAEALTSDDPLVLSNNHVYWAPSPWTFRFDPGMQLTTAQTRAMWNFDEQWFAEDSNRHYLTFLRGGSASWNVGDVASLTVTAATPLGLWDFYETVTSIPIAARFVMHPNDKLTVGATYTSKYGVDKHTIRAQNYVVAFDATYNLWEKTDVYGEVGASTLKITHPNEQLQNDVGNTFKVGMRTRWDIDSANIVKFDTSFTHMSQKFAPGLADYRDSREDRDWGRHIWFDPLSAEDQAIRIGDSIDINRNTIGANLRAQLMDNFLDLYLNLRNAHESYTDKFIENITRFEATCTPAKQVQFKALLLDRIYHDTRGDHDPTLRDRYTDELLLNYDVDDGRKVQLITASGGVKVDLAGDKLTLYGVYEATNDPQDFPRGILNSPAFNTLNTYDNIIFNDIMNQVYQQDLFNLPAYEFFNMWKGCVVWRPSKDVQIRYTHVTNTNRNYAALFDNNHNHDEIEFTWNPVKGIVWTTGWSCSRVIDLQRAVDTNGSDRVYGDHQNVYSRVNWDFRKDQRLTFQFGEAWLVDPKGSVFGPNWVSTNTSVLDTRAIFRVWYQGKF